ncbi:MAG TPA: ATP-binding cassette domain-containing protein, partial [Bauldia sp.]|nr:ATP-binding cassette domain-containing protein [Bauldia sp.]
MTALLDLVGIRVRFPVGKGRLLHALDGVDLSLDAGDSIGIVGESGSGKSTLARVVARLLDPSDGTVAFDGRDIAAVPAARFARDPARRAIQLVFQHADDALNPAFSIRRNIAVGLGGTRLGPDQAARADAAAAAVGLDAALLDRRPHQLSGGQQTRATIARALIS